MYYIYIYIYINVHYNKHQQTTADIDPIGTSPSLWRILGGKFQDGPPFLGDLQILYQYSYGPLPVISTYNPIYRMYNPIYNQL